MAGVQPDNLDANGQEAMFDPLDFLSPDTLEPVNQPRIDEVSTTYAGVQKAGLAEAGFTYDEEYVIMLVPNIVDISYGRGVGYTFTQHDLGADIHEISATKIREQLRSNGKI